jgi:hypothetical protein
VLDHFDDAEPFEGGDKGLQFRVGTGARSDAALDMNDEGEVTVTLLQRGDHTSEVLGRENVARRKGVVGVGDS